MARDICRDFFNQNLFKNDTHSLVYFKRSKIQQIACQEVMNSTSEGNLCSFIILKKIWAMKNRLEMAH